MALPVIPKKSLGQNFLNSNRVINRIVDASEITPEDTVLEIGPGLGAITEKLIPRARKVIAIEKDTELVTLLNEKFENDLHNKKLILVQDNVLNFNTADMLKYSTNGYIITANIPYNITGLIIRKFLENQHQPKKMILLIQKEVAERILARDKKESLLSLSVKVYGVPKLITHVARGNFNPPPKVDSAVIKIDSINKKHFPDENFEKLFFQIIHAGFAHKRKVLVKNLVDADIASREKLLSIFTERNLSHTIRAEDVTLDDWIFITNIVYTNT